MFLTEYFFQVVALFLQYSLFMINRSSSNKDLKIKKTVNEGLGIDWGVTFTNIQDTVHKEEQNHNNFAELDDQGLVCIFHDQEVVTLEGTCSSIGSCHVGHVDYFGASCHGLVTGTMCRVQTDQFTAVQGTCSAGGHCRSLQGQVRLHHEACVSTRAMDMDKMDRVKQFIRNNINKNHKVLQDSHQKVSKSVVRQETSSFKNQNINKIKSSNPAECRGLYNPSAFTKLENICTDCYNLFKEPEVHTFCMSGCFDSSFFFTCVKSLMIEEDMVRDLVKMVGK